MQKQTLIDTINQQGEMEPELKQEILAFVQPLPDELSEDDVKNVDAFLGQVEADESEVAYLTQSLIDENQNMLTGLEHARSEYVVNTAQTMKTGLSHLEELKAQSEPLPEASAMQVSPEPTMPETPPVAEAVPPQSDQQPPAAPTPGV